MTDATVSTAHAISPDSGQVWTAEGAWPVADGVYRIPLPLPMDGLRAINVYALTGPDGVTLIDGGWVIDEARDALASGLASIGVEFSDVTRILVTHVHRDHYTLASALGHEFGTEVYLGEGERPILDLAHEGEPAVLAAFSRALDRAGAGSIGRQWRSFGDKPQDPAWWSYPSKWINNHDVIPAGARSLEAIHTPGHTPGHLVFLDHEDGLMFSGDHVLPTITPSIGFTEPVQADPLGVFLDSLRRVADLPDMRLLSAHGPIAPSTHARVAELLQHHDERLALTESALRESALEGVTGAGVSGSATAFDVTQRLRWTRHERGFAELRLFDQVLAVRETAAHLDVLAARGSIERHGDGDGPVRYVAGDDR